MERKRILNVFKQAQEAGAYDEYPVFPASIDPQLHLSRNARPQPFYLICVHDTVLSQMSGQASVEFKAASVLSYSLEPGDSVYVPAGTPHRIIPQTESVQLRYKVEQPGLEGIAWYCSGCGVEVWNTAEELPQEGYWRACQLFSTHDAQRVCGQCGAENPPVDLTGIRWPEIAASIRSEQD